jgi:hypothetical protein
MTKTGVWEEIRKTKSYILGIEQYTSEKRKYNRGSKWLIFLVSVSCVLSSFFQFFDLLSWVKWSTLVTSILVVIITIIKDFKPIFGQSEDELRDLDDICDFYKRYLTDLEKFFSSECNDSSEFTDKKRDEFERIVNTVAGRETKMKRLCRGSYWESKKIEQKTTADLRDTFPHARAYYAYYSYE